MSKVLGIRKIGGPLALGGTAWARRLGLVSLTVVGQTALFLAGTFPVTAKPPSTIVASAAVLRDHVPGRILVQTKPGVPERAMRRLVASRGARQIGAISQINVHVLRVPETSFATVLVALQRDRDVRFAEPDYVREPALTPNDTYYSMEWHLAVIQAPWAWDLTTGAPGVIIAILDSGIDAAHPDLAGVLVPGWNVFDNNANTSDVTGHGTGVAGSACAAGNNGIGIAAPAWGCRLMPIRVTDTSGLAADSMIAAGLTYAADHAARVANASFEMLGTSYTLSAAAQYFQSKGGVFTMAAGNDTSFDGTPDDPYIMRISGTDAGDTLASFSATGNNIDVSAPAVSIVTTTRGGGYGYATGTSAAAPLVAGVAALMLSANPTLTGAEVRDLLEQTADDLGNPGWDPDYGWGRLNAYKAVQTAVNATLADTSEPTAQIVAPSAGSVVSNVVTIAATAADNVGVTRVECYLDGALLGTSASASALFSWNSTVYTNGSHALQARGYDAAGNVGASALVTVTVQNVVLDTTPPTVQITSPGNGATVGQATSVTVVATDNVGITQVDLLVEGKLYNSSSSPTTVFSWNTGKLSPGPHTLQSVACDAAGNQTRSSIVTVYK